MTKKLQIHLISCRTPQEGGLFSDGDEVWARLTGDGGQPVFSPESGRDTHQMVRGRDIRCHEDMRVIFSTSAQFDLWDDDTLAPGDSQVEKRDNKLLGSLTFFFDDVNIISNRVTIIPGDRAEGAVYDIVYSLTDA